MQVGADGACPLDAVDSERVPRPCGGAGPGVVYPQLCFKHIVLGGMPLLGLLGNISSVQNKDLNAARRSVHCLPEFRSEQSGGCECWFLVAVLWKVKAVISGKRLPTRRVTRPLQGSHLQMGQGLRASQAQT